MYSSLSKFNSSSSSSSSPSYWFSNFALLRHFCQLKLGDVLEFYKPREKLRFYGIYVGEDRGNLRFVYLTNKSDSPSFLFADISKKNIIRLVNFKGLSLRYRFRITNKWDMKWKPQKENEIVYTAMSFLKNPDLLPTFLFVDSEHFAKFCRYAKYEDYGTVLLTTTSLKKFVIRTLCLSGFVGLAIHYEWVNILRNNWAIVEFGTAILGAVGAFVGYGIFEILNNWNKKTIRYALEYL